ncbi:hypothetical protein ACFWB0_25145 [Rhodococcus sp. NPDC060086]|uniref:hypothetical protein n=1 Tax=Rhodococcus sp. NPDC060086 TaxID=3347055 RepID=UPI003652487F
MDSVGAVTGGDAIDVKEHGHGVVLDAGAGGDCDVLESHLFGFADTAGLGESVSFGD